MAKKDNQKKSGNNLAIIIIVLVLLGAGGYFLLKGKGGGTIPGTGISMPSGKGEEFVGSLKAAVDMGVPFKCSYTINDVDYESHIKGKNMRGKIKQDGKDADIIISGNCMWTWNKEEGMGMKMCFEDSDSWWDSMGEAAEEMTEDFQTQGNMGMQPQMPDIEYKCRPAVVSDDMFTPPTDIQFMDFDSMMQGGY